MEDMCPCSSPPCCGDAPLSLSGEMICSSSFSFLLMKDAAALYFAIFFLLLLS